eukprot:gb/GECH01010548.1/.p1 GENE.gb/GECH01010548.1/~~gb/GECH01010548.1/.p1  ORF type:complete len:775 (+),score=181.75 gb/GECH01010548.1/:1-2325(+)
MAFADNEQINGLRWSWNTIPSTKTDASSMVVPISALYKPMNVAPDAPQTLPYNPLTCKKCNAALNPFCGVDYRNMFWSCPFCFQRNPFPPTYQGISETHKPAELYTQYSSVEYALQGYQAPPPVFLFVIDTSLNATDLDLLRNSILMAFNSLPENARVGLITFGTVVNIYELGVEECVKSYVFNGSKEVTIDAIHKQLGMATTNAGARPTPQSMQTAGSVATRSSQFLRSASECEFVFFNIMDDLQPDPWPVRSDQRPKRCTGPALSAAVSLLETCHKGSGARIMLFTGGPSSWGPGRVVGLKHKERLRFHNDLKSGSAQHTKSATKFYEKLTSRIASNGHTVDIWSANLDQVGIMEMRSCADNTGGIIVNGDSFSSDIFEQSLSKFFKKTGEHLDMGLNAHTTVQTSPDIKICGAIGPVVALDKRTDHDNISNDTVIGYGKTNHWKICSMDQNTTIAFYFEVSNNEQAQAGGTASGGDGGHRYVQFMTKYQHACGEYRLKVTTQPLRAVNMSESGVQEIAGSFDQEAAAVLIARVAVFKAETQELYDVLRWLDRVLIRLATKFGSYVKGQPDSLQLSNEFKLYPQFMYNLRRSQFLQIFNSSPDETAFFRSILNKSDCTSSLLMIQPSLTCYDLSGEEPYPVLLDSTEVTADRVLLLDTFFTLVIHRGQNVAAWEQAGYHEQPEYANIKQLLEKPVEDASQIMSDRFPHPMYIVCNQHKSQARFLLSRLNPATTHHNLGGAGGGQSEIIYTDDAPLHVFIDHLKKLVTENGQK